MTAGSLPTHRWLLSKPRLDDLLRLLAGDGYEVIGPRVEQGAIIYAPIQSTQDLPIGWTDRQAPGSYRLEKRDDEAYFGYAVGPHSWKKYLFPPTLQLWKAVQTATGFEIRAEEYDPPKRAFVGLRSCELHALAVQDRVFIKRDGRFTDPHYAKARERLFLIAVECEHPGGTCFCVSMGTGPEVQPDQVPSLTPKHEDAEDLAGDKGRLSLRESPFFRGAKDDIPESNSRRNPDRQAEREGEAQMPPAADSASVPSEAAATLPVCDLVLTELDADFVIRAVSPAGQQVVERLGLPEASGEQVADARRRVEEAARSMGRTVDVTGIRDLLHRNQEHPRWDDVASRCLACTNCTMVCPTCFCSHTEDHTELSLQTAERIRRWDSCFNPEFGQVHGGNFRPSIRGRYRQWLTHKFASWFDQFDVSGCVGCGRCITWCPVGIDVTDEITAIRMSDGQREEKKT